MQIGNRRSLGSRRSGNAVERYTYEHALNDDTQRPRVRPTPSVAVDGDKKHGAKCLSNDRATLWLTIVVSQTRLTTLYHNNSNRDGRRALPMPLLLPLLEQKINNNNNDKYKAKQMQTPDAKRQTFCLCEYLVPLALRQSGNPCQL